MEFIWQRRALGQANSRALEENFSTSPRGIQEIRNMCILGLAGLLRQYGAIHIEAEKIFPNRDKICPAGLLHSRDSPSLQQCSQCTSVLPALSLPQVLLGLRNGIH